ncbi:MAG: hypothetical protein ACYS8W_07795 [Planctomycetota bacterium]|jgi:hypothetical protein
MKLRPAISFQIPVFLAMLFFPAAFPAEGAGKDRKAFAAEFRKEWAGIEKSYARALVEFARSGKEHPGIAKLLLERAKEVSPDDSEISKLEKTLAEGAADPAALRRIEKILRPLDGEKAKADLVRAGMDAEEAKTSGESGADALAGKLEKLQKSTASYFFSLAKEAYGIRARAKAFCALRAALEYDASHEKARKALGYLRHGEAWLKSFDIAQLEKGLVRTAKWGWVTPEAKKNLDAGKFPLGEKYVDASEYREALAASWGNAAVVETEHFRITSNAGLRMAVEVGRFAEEHYENLFSLFAILLRTGSGKGITEGLMPQSFRKHRINFYASRKSFMELAAEFCGGKVPRSYTGFFAFARGVSCFYDDGHGDWKRNLVHECTHQIINDFGREKKTNLQKANAWVAEALPVFMEFARPLPDGSYRLSPLSGRVRDGLLAKAEKKLVPFPEFAKLGFRDFHAKCDELRLSNHGTAPYGQAAIMAHFFLSHAAGKYMLDFLDYVSWCHYGGGGADALEDELEVDMETLEKEWGEFLDELYAKAKKLQDEREKK